MKLIDAEALKAEILKSPVWTGLDAIAKINTMPHIDIVRCKECRWADKYHHCNYMTTWNNANDFCSRGKFGKDKL